MIAKQLIVSGRNSFRHWKVIAKNTIKIQLVRSRLSIWGVDLLIMQIEQNGACITSNHRIMHADSRFAHFYVWEFKFMRMMIFSSNEESLRLGEYKPGASKTANTEFLIMPLGADAKLKHWIGCRNRMVLPCTEERSPCTVIWKQPTNLK